MAAGDATFHSGVTLHRAPGNPTNRVRDVMTVIYIADNRNPNNPRHLFSNGFKSITEYCPAVAGWTPLPKAIWAWSVAGVN